MLAEVLIRPMTSERRHLKSGLLSHHAAGAELDYFSYIPTTATSESPVLITIHGIERLALQHAVRFAPYAEANGLVVIAPHFSKARAPRYQRTAANKDGECPVDALDLTVDHFLRTARITPAGMHMFGYSGGAQFAMRYLLRGSLPIDRVALAAPGWFTMPDHSQPFPYGLGRSNVLRGSELNLQRLLSTPILLTVGSEDRIRNRSLNREERIDLHQGKDRVERAIRWSEAMAAAADARGMPRRVELRIIDGAGHSFQDNMNSQDLGEIVTRWLLRKQDKIH